MPSIENFLTFDYWQYETIRHFFALTAAVFAAALVYFAMTAKDVAPRFRKTAAISAVVMVSATIELFQLWWLWNTAFARTADGFRVIEGAVFSNGYRYANWMIDVPMLLTQLLVVLGYTGAAFMTRWAKLTGAGLGMIVLGYIGQYYEPAAAGIANTEQAWLFWAWGAASTVVFVYLLYVVHDSIANPQETLSDDVKASFRTVWSLILGSWTIYVIAYAMPAIWPTADGVVLRQGIYTIADIASKAVYGVLLSNIALKRSAEEGFGFSRAIMGERLPEAEGVVPVRDAARRPAAA